MADRWIRRLVVVASAAAVSTVSAFATATAAVAAGTTPTVVSLTFDDGYTFHTWVSDQLLARNMHGSFFIPSGFVDAMDGSAMTWPEAKALSDAGQDVGGHTRDHVDLTSTSTSYDYKYTQTCGDRDEAIRNGIDAVSFAYPYGNNNSAAQTLVKTCGYESARTVSGLRYAGPPYAETVPPVNVWAIRALADFKSTHPTAADLENAVQAVLAHGGGWLPLVFHGVCIPSWDNYTDCWALGGSVDSAQFTQFLDWLKTQPVSVKSVAEVISPGGVRPSRVSIDSLTTTHLGLQVSGSAGQQPWDTATVTLTAYSGKYATGSPAFSAPAAVTQGQWSVMLPGPIKGSFTLVATQKNSYGATGYSNQQHPTLDVPAPTNQTPVAANDSYSVPQDTALTVAAPGVLGNDTDGDGDPLTAVVVSNPGHGTLTLAASGGFTYTPATGYAGADTFTYKASDGLTASPAATVAVTVIAPTPVPTPSGSATPTPTPTGSPTPTPSPSTTPPATMTPSASPTNAAPVARADSFQALRNTTFSVPAPGVLRNDSDADGDALTAVRVSGPAHGKLTLGLRGGFTYTPTAGYVGGDSFTYRAGDGSLDSADSTVSLAVRIPTSLRMTASASTITYPGGARLRTGLSQGGTALAGRTVTVQRCAVVRTGTTQVCAPWTTVKTLRTGASGTASYVAHPPWNVRFRWHYAGTSRLAAVNSRVAAVAVRPAVAVRASAATLAHGSRVTLTATVRPNHAGQWVVLQRYVRGTGWVQVARVALRSGDASTSRGGVGLVLARAGTFTYRFVMPADARHARAASGAVTVHVT